MRSGDVEHFSGTRGRTGHEQEGTHGVVDVQVVAEVVQRVEVQHRR